MNYSQRGEAIASSLRLSTMAGQQTSNPVPLSAAFDGQNIHHHDRRPSSLVRGQHSDPALKSMLLM